MKIAREKDTSALTLIEVLIVVAILLLLAAILLPSLARSRSGSSPSFRCMNNLKQIGVAYRLWEQDHGSKFPMQVSTNHGGTMEYVEGPNAWRHFQIMSNELNTPKILFCPEDSAPRGYTRYFDPLSNTNLSYFVGVDAEDIHPQRFLSGDRNLTNGTPTRSQLLELTTNRLTGWTGEMHRHGGNIGLADGSVQGVETSALRDALKQTGMAMNRLAMP